MKHILFIALSVVLLQAFSAPLYASDSPVYPPDIQRIKERGKLIVAMFVEDIPPFFMHDKEGRFYGLDVDLARGIAASLGVEVEFNRKAHSFNEIIDILARKEADVGISWLSRTLERSEKIRYTEPYIVLRQGLLINRLKLAELPGHENPLKALNHPDARVGLRRGTSYEDFAHRIFPRSEIVKYPDWDPEIVEAVVKGELVAGYHDEIEIKKYILRYPEASIHVNTAVIKDLTDPIAMAVPWDSHTLLGWLNTYIEDHVAEWDADKLLQEYRESFDLNGE